MAAGFGLKVMLAHAGTPDRGFMPVVRQLAALDRHRVHALVEDPRAADVIVFLDVNEHAWDPDLIAVRRHPLAVRYPEKALVYDEQDQPWCAMPGLYVSMPKPGFDRRRQRACGYVTQTINPLIAANPSGGPSAHVVPDLLFSFVGRKCHRARDAVLRLTHPRGLVIDTSDFASFGDGDGGPSSVAAGDDPHRRYVDMLRRSKFVLCPRGAGTTSYRLFEAMWAGRAPVVLSDDWVPPAGPAWERFALRVPEARAAHVTQIVEAHEARAGQMGLEARRQWDAWFAPDVRFHRMADECAWILRSRRLPEFIARRLPNARRWRLRLRRWKARVLERDGRHPE